jgi:hypothetical protein
MGLPDGGRLGEIPFEMRTVPAREDAAVAEGFASEKLEAARVSERQSSRHRRGEVRFFVIRWFRFAPPPATGSRPFGRRPGPLCLLCPFVAVNCGLTLRLPPPCPFENPNLSPARAADLRDLFDAPFGAEERERGGAVLYHPGHGFHVAAGDRAVRGVSFPAESRAAARFSYAGVCDRGDAGEVLEERAGAAAARAPGTGGAGSDETSELKPVLNILPL